MLNRNVKLYGPMNVLEIKNSSSCWNSQGTADGSGIQIQQQWIQIEFPGRIVLPSALRVQFQPGFSCRGCQVQFLQQQEHQQQQDASSTSDRTQWKPVGQEQELDWEDVHSLQENAFGIPHLCSAIRLVWDNEQFTDFYGRVVIYQLQVWGQESAAIFS